MSLRCIAQLEFEMIVWKASLIKNDSESARNALASLLTRKRGEYILRLGVRPPQDTLFAGEPLDGASGWTGVARTEDDIHVGVVGIEQVLGEIGGKV